MTELLCDFAVSGDGVPTCRRCGKRWRTHRPVATLRAKCGVKPPPAAAASVGQQADAVVDDLPWWPRREDGSLLSQFEMTAEHLPCPHRGEVLRRDERCSLCGQTDRKYDVYACDQAGECSLIPSTKGQRIQDCLKCSVRRAAVTTPLGSLPIAPPVTSQRTGPIRVAFITPTMGMGGAERWILALCKAWSTRDEIDVRCIAITDGGQSWQPFVTEAHHAGVPVYASERRHPTQPNAETHIERFPDGLEPIRRATRGVDIVIHWGIHRIGALLRAVGWTGPSVCVSHGSLAATRPMLAAAEDGSTHFAAVSQKAAEAYPEHLWPQVQTLWNGCEVDRIVPTRPAAEVRREWGCSPGDLLIGHVGRLAFDKNPLAIAHAAVALRARMPHRRVRPVWVGNGWQQDEVRRQATNIVGDAGVWVPPPRHLGDAWGALDAYVLASPAEGFALALCEALLCGVPTVATPVGCVPEIEREFGRLVLPVPVSPTDEQLAEGIEVALSEEHRPNVRRARTVVWEHFTAAAMATRWATWLNVIRPPTIMAGPCRK